MSVREMWEWVGIGAITLGLAGVLASLGLLVVTGDLQWVVYIAASGVATVSVWLTS